MPCVLNLTEGSRIPSKPFPLEVFSDHSRVQGVADDLILAVLRRDAPLLYWRASSRSFSVSKSAFN
jgi:hypothetical protein